MSLDQYSQTPASNDLANYFQTGMRPSAVKVAGWDIMADLAMQIGAGSLPTTGGTANAQTITNTRQVGTLYAGLRFRVLPSATNTGAMTFAPDGLAAKNVFANGVAAIAGMWVINVPADIVYDGTQWNLMNPQRSTGSFTGTLTGMSGTTTGTVNYAVNQDGKTFSVWIATNITGTSTTTAMTMTGIPALLVCGTAKSYACAVVDSNTGSMGNIDTGTSTTWSFYKNAALSGFTGSSTKGLGTNPHFSFVGSTD